MKNRALNEKDKTEGKEFSKLVGELDKESKMMLLVYAGALRDRQLLQESKSKQAS